MTLQAFCFQSQPGRDVQHRNVSQIGSLSLWDQGQPHLSLPQKQMMTLSIYLNLLGWTASQNVTYRRTIKHKLNPSCTTSLHALHRGNVERGTKAPWNAWLQLQWLAAEGKRCWHTLWLWKKKYLVDGRVRVEEDAPGWCEWTWTALGETEVAALQEFVVWLVPGGLRSQGEGNSGGKNKQRGLTPHFT